MIVRIYRCTPKQNKLSDYEKFLMREAVPILQKVNGCLGAKMLKSIGVVREVLFITLWENLDALQQYAGQHWNQPRMHGNESTFLEGEPEVKHYHQVEGF